MEGSALQRSLSGYRTRDEAGTRAVAAQLARSLEGGDIVLLYGALGAGKTAFTRGLLEGLGGDAEAVSSPSFALLNIYEGGRLPLYHMDLYRVDAASMDMLGFDDYLFGEGVCAVEWPDAAMEWLRGAEVVMVTIDDADDGGRDITIERKRL